MADVKDLIGILGWFLLILVMLAWATINHLPPSTTKTVIVMCDSPEFAAPPHKIIQLKPPHTVLI